MGDRHLQRCSAAEPCGSRHGFYTASNDDERRIIDSSDNIRILETFQPVRELIIDDVLVRD